MMYDQNAIFDPRTSGLPLVNQYTGFGISLLYTVSVYGGYTLMRNRKRWSLGWFVPAHNLFLCVLSMYMFVETCLAVYNLYDNPVCTPMDYLDTRLSNVLYVHYLSKIYEIVDTFMIIVKKKDRQLSFLHVYHHAVMVFPVWNTAILLHPGGASYFACAINSFVHVWMYLYYGLASVGMGFLVKPIKPWLTTMQITQFVCAFLHSLWVVLGDCNGDIPLILPFFQLSNSVVFFGLFVNFYMKNYTRKPRERLRERRSKFLLSKLE